MRKCVPYIAKDGDSAVAADGESLVTTLSRFIHNRFYILSSVQAEEQVAKRTK